MNDNIIENGDRVEWTHRGKVRMGTVEDVVAWSDYVRVIPDGGKRNWVRKEKLTKLTAQPHTREAQGR